MGKMFEMLKEGLEEILEHQKGRKKLKTRVVEIPEPAHAYTAKEVKKIRDFLGYSQGNFARFLNVSIRTVESWESGKRNPNHAALRLLEIVEKGYYPPRGTRKSA